MFNVLSGDIDFYPGWTTRGQVSIRAPNLKTKGQEFTSLTPRMTVKESEDQKDLVEMMKFVGINNTSMAGR